MRASDLVCLGEGLCYAMPSHSVMSDSLQPHGLQLPGSSVHGDPPGKNTGVGCHFLLQQIFPTQGLNPGLPHCRWILYCLSHQGSPRTWSGWSIPSSGELPDPGTELRSALQVDSLPAELPGKPGWGPRMHIYHKFPGDAATVVAQGPDLRIPGLEQCVQM